MYQNLYMADETMRHVAACRNTDAVFRALGLSWSKADWQFYQLVYSTFFAAVR